MQRILFSIVVLTALGTASHAVETKTWEHSSQADFEKGTLKKLSLRSDGRLFLAPASKEILDSSVAYLWALAEDSKGNLYAGGGGPGASAARLFRIDASGKTESLAELEGLQVQAIAIDRRDRLYAATAPDGKVYRVSRDGEAEVYYDPRTKYIWAMAFNSKGELFVATGDAGDIHRVSPDGQGSVFFKTEETHVRSLAVDARDNVIVGTEPNGLIMRISPAGKGFVLHQSDKREITTVAVAPDGSIYAAGVGAKKPTTVFPVTPRVSPSALKPATSAAATPNTPAPVQTTSRTTTTTRPSAVLGIRPTVTGGSDVYRIDPDGFPLRIWSDSKEIVYSIAIDREGRVVFGTGNSGKVFRLDSDHLYTLLLSVPPAQVTSLHAGRRGRLFAVTGNVGKVYQIGPELEKLGSFESEVLDAGYFSYWGRLSFRGDPKGRVEWATRSGNLDRPQQNWSSWSPVELSGRGGRMAAPAARFLQYKLTLTAPGEKESPEVTHVVAAYLHKNVAPVLEKIAATPPNYKFPPRSLSITRTKNLTLPPLSGTRRAPSPKPVTTSTQSMQYAKGFIGARWLARDDNDDELEYKVEIRGGRETEWKLLKDELDNAHLSWDSTAFSDGEYRLRVTASDKPGNPPRQALAAQLEGEPFLIDNTPPRIVGLSAPAANRKITVRWKAADAHTVINKAEYSLDGGDWTIVEPTIKLSDSLELEYALELDDVTPGEHTIAVRVTDEFDNQAVEKVVVR